MELLLSSGMGRLQVHSTWSLGQTVSDQSVRNGLFGVSAKVQVVRQHSFPKHKLSYTGKVAFRVLVPQSSVEHIPGVKDFQGSCFWHTRDTHIYTNPLDNGLFEIATRAIVPDEIGAKVSWGQEINREEVLPHYTVSQC